MPLHDLCTRFCPSDPPFGILEYQIALIHLVRLRGRTRRDRRAEDGGDEESENDRTTHEFLHGTRVGKNVPKPALPKAWPGEKTY